MPEGPTTVSYTHLADNEFYGIAVNKNNKALLEQINAALAELKASGTYDQIFQKWFGAN